MLTKCLCESEASLLVDFEDFLNGRDVGGRPQVQTQVVLHCCPHDVLSSKKQKVVITMITAYLIWMPGIVLEIGILN